MIEKYSGTVFVIRIDRLEELNDKINEILKDSSFTGGILNDDIRFEIRIILNNVLVLTHYMMSRRELIGFARGFAFCMEYKEIELERF